MFELPKKKFYKITEKNGFEKSFDKKEFNIIMLYPEFKYQKILGFAGAFTESSGYVFSKFSDDVKKKFIEDL